MTWHAIRHGIWQALPMFVVVLAGFTLIGTNAGSVEPLKREQTELELRFANLQQEHHELETWVIEKFRPWVERQVQKQADALPPDVPAPSIPPPPPPPPSTSPTTPPSASVSPSPTDSIIPEPSPTCVPVVDICLSVGLSVA